MPVILSSQEKHPFLPSPGDVSTIDLYRAQHQDIRPMEIAIVNLMADKIGTERQLATWLGDTPIQVHLTFVAPDDYVYGIQAGRESKNTPSEHIRKFYHAFSDVSDRKFDGLIITGVNALEVDMTKEKIWPQVEEILDWSETHAVSSLFLCWGAQAALKHFHGLDRTRLGRKNLGVYTHRKLSDKTGLLRQLPDTFPIPVARWDETEIADVQAVPELELVCDAEGAGAGIIVEAERFDDGNHLYPHRVYVLSHPEYETETLASEYWRDVGNDPTIPLPRQYFPSNDPTQKPYNSWRHTACIYRNWVDAVYNATPYNLEAVPQPYKRVA